MRVAYCETSAGALRAFIEAGGPVVLVDLYTLTMAGGTVYRWTSAPANVTTPDARTFLATGPALTRGRTVQSAGLEVSTLDVTLGAAGAWTLAGVPLVRAAVDRVFEGASLQLETGFIDASGALVGTIVEFIGTVYDVRPESSRVVLTFASPLQTLATKQIPVRSYIPECQRMLYDAGCGVVKNTYKASSSVSAAAGPITATSFGSIVSRVDDWFSGGVLLFTSGANAGIRASIADFVSMGGFFTLATALPNVPADGDTFDAWPGCDKTRTTCESKFANLARFGGFPYVPTEDTTFL